MHCISCDLLLDANVSGFIICPNCHTVNVPNGKSELIQQPSIVNTSEIPSSNPGMPNIPSSGAAILKNITKPSHVSKKTALAKGSIGCLIVLVFAFTTFLFYQNARANSLLNLARSAITKGQYTSAASLLSGASKYYSLPANHKKITQLISQDKIWIADANYLQQATSLVQKQNFSGATFLINKIYKTFPGYSAVISLQQLIASDQNTLAIKQKAAAAQVAAQAAAQTAAKNKSVSAQSISPTPTGSNNTSKPGTRPENTIPVVTGYGYNFYYSGAKQSVVASGASVDFTQAQPQVTQNNGSQNHSLMELSVEPASGSNTVEVGWIVDQPQFGDSLPHLFVYHFTNGQTTCYNGCGFVQASTKNTPGEAIMSGTSANFEINFSNNAWNIYYNGDDLGYFPASLWSGGFTQTGLIQIFGEVATTSTMCIQMGNGIAGTQPGSAQFSSFALLGSSSASALYPFTTASSPYSYGNATSTGLNIGGPGSC
jgi:hypothetical protein